MSKDQRGEKKTVLVEFDNGVAWVTLNRPEKRNAMNPTLNQEMLDTLNALEGDDRCQVLVLTGAGESFAAGMDLREYFRALDDKPRIERIKAQRTAYEWQWRRLMYFEKPTIAMVNGWCFGGAFTPVVACDLAIAANEATFGISEINWGILPGGNVTRAAHIMGDRNALYYIMTGLPFDGAKAASMGLVNESVPLAQLRQRTRELCDVLLQKNTNVLKAAKDTYKRTAGMPWDLSEDYIIAKMEQLFHLDKMKGRNTGIKQFLDDKTLRPGLGTYDRSKEIS